MNTETTETVKGWVFFDDACPICRGWANRSFGILVRRGLHPVPLQAAWARERLGVMENEALAEMKFLTRDGFLYGGADALIQIARRIWWAWPLFAMAHFPGMKLLLRKLYRKLAASRYCLGGNCAIPVESSKEPRRVASAFYELP